MSTPMNPMDPRDDALEGTTSGGSDRIVRGDSFTTSERLDAGESLTTSGGFDAGDSLTASDSLSVEPARTPAGTAMTTSSMPTSGGSQGGPSRVGQAAGQVGQAAGQVGQAASKVVTSARQRVSGLAQSLRRNVQSNPIGFAFGGVGLGLIAGMLAPASRKEEQTMAPAAGRVNQGVSKATQSVRVVARETAEYARQLEQESKEQG